MPTARASRSSFFCYAAASAALLGALVILVSPPLVHATDPPTSPPTPTEPDPLAAWSLIREPAFNPNAPLLGRVRLVDPDGLTVQTWTSPQPNDMFGLSAIVLPDVNGDGIPDAAIAAPNAFDEQAGVRIGTIRIASGADGSTISTLSGTPLDRFGLTMFAAADAATSSVAVTTLVELLDPATNAPFAARAFTFQSFDAFTGAFLGEALQAPAGFTHQAAIESLATHVRAAGPADLNADGEVGAWDLSILAGNYGAEVDPVTGELLQQTPGLAAAPTGDTNGDGVVNEQDLATVLGSFGQSTDPSFAPVEGVLTEAEASAIEGAFEQAMPQGLDCIHCAKCDKGWCQVLPGDEMEDDTDLYDQIGGDDDEDGSPGSDNPPGGTDTDGDGIDDENDCDSPIFVGAVATDCRCQDDNTDGVLNQNQCGHPCYSGTITACADECDDSAEVVIMAAAINRDTPTSTTSHPLTGTPPVVYGGSEDSTSDHLMLHAAIVPSGMQAQVVSYTWSVSGDGSSAFSPPTPGPDADTWEVGPVPPEPGTMTFKCEVRFADEDMCDAEHEQEIEVGIRTDDVIVVGWINPSGVLLPIGSVDPSIFTHLPASGPPVQNSLWVNLFLLDLSENWETPNFVDLNDPQFPNNRDYILHWMFKYGGNTDPITVIPGGDFRDQTGSHIDWNEVSAFESSRTNYKLFNRLQIRYRVASQGGFAAPPIVLQSATGIGHTSNPTGGLFGFMGTIPGQSGAMNGTSGVYGPALPRYSQTNDGSPDARGIRVFNTLKGKGVTPVVFWENIGSRISFQPDGQTWPGTIRMQPYPTYHVFRNGALVNTYPQAPSPIGNFVADPYPFGTVHCFGIGGVTPGGRCGDAGSAPGHSARIPPSGYTIP